MKKILITGASGFIGRFLVEDCLKRGYEVYATVRKTSKIDHLKHLDVRFIVVDLSHIDSLVSTLKDLPKMDFIIHNAGLTKAFEQQDYISTNVTLTKNLVEALKKSDRVPTKLLYVSSLAAYGPGNPDSIEPVTNESIPQPVTSYGTSKLAAERFVMKQEQIPWIVVRPTAVYGPGERDIFEAIKLMNARFDFRVGSIPQNLTFVYVKDLVRAKLDLLESDVVRKAYFVSDGNIYSKKHMGRYVSKALNKKILSITIPMPLVKVVAFITEKYSRWITKKAPALNIEKIAELTARNWNCDIKPLQQDIGYMAKYDLEDGIRETITWYKENKWIK